MFLFCLISISLTIELNDVMKVQQKKYTEDKGWEIIKTDALPPDAYRLVLVFGSRFLLSDPDIYTQIKQQYPKADILMSSTSGEIIDLQVNDETISLTAIGFENTLVRTAVIDIDKSQSSFKAGYNLASEFDTAGLRSLLVISDGHNVNGSDLVAGLREFLPDDIIITGGLAGDGARFECTLVGLNATPAEGKAAAIGFYGDALQIGYGSVGGWDTFGIERLITASDGNVLYELDSKPALDVYKLYLGEYADELPGSALLFPLNVRLSDSEHTVVRTILAVNEEDKSMTFAGNMPKGAYAQMMKANFDRLIDGASQAAANSIIGQEQAPELALLISCVGRKLVLDQRIEEEVEVVRAVYGNDTAITGFYSYGEISPLSDFIQCELHNQTMTITTYREGK